MFLFFFTLLIPYFFNLFSRKNVLLKKRLKKQSKNKSIYFKQRSARDSLIDLKTMTYKQLDCFVRALQDPYPNACFKFNNLNIKINTINTKYKNMFLIKERNL